MVSANTIHGEDKACLAGCNLFLFMSGPGADDWSLHERSNILLFYRLAGELVEVLPGLLPKTNN
jgi:hypothetical protein